MDALARRGFRSTGIDASSVMIERARRKLRGEYHAYSFQEITKLKDTFFCVFSIGNSISYLRCEERQKLLRDLSTLHCHGGSLVLQIVNWDQFLHTGGREFQVKELSGGRSFHRSYEFISEEQVLFNTELRKGDDILGSWSDSLFPVRSGDLAGELASVGYEAMRLQGGYDGASFSEHDSGALIVTARRG